MLLKIHKAAPLTTLIIYLLNLETFTYQNRGMKKCSSNLVPVTKYPGSYSPPIRLVYASRLMAVPNIGFI